MKLLVVTDPMCSWCWGMSAEVDRAANELDASVELDFLLGGINTHGTQPIGDFGRRHLMKIWREVHATTGQQFGFKLPDSFVYNSTLPCLAVQVVREHLGKPPFGYLHRLQQLFFVEGRNINDAELVAEVAEDFGVPRDTVRQESSAERIRQLVGFEFSTSRGYGTNALPSVLWERDGERGLLAGGYLDSATLVDLARRKNDSLRQVEID